MKGYIGTKDNFIVRTDTARGERVCAIVRDTFFVEAPLSELDESIRLTKAAMLEANALALDGFKLSTDVEIVHRSIGIFHQFKNE